MTDTTGEFPDPATLSALAADALDDLKGTDIQTLDVRDKTSVADFMVLATGSSSRHVKSLAERVVERVEAQGLRALGIEGTDSCEWVLVDLGDVLVHVMQAQTRDLYALEKLWSVGAGGRAQSATPD